MKRASTAKGIVVEPGRHSVVVRSREAFGDARAPWCADFIRRALQLTEVSSVEVDARRGRAVVRFHEAQHDVAALLRRLAEALREPRRENGRGAGWEVTGASRSHLWARHDDLARRDVADRVRTRVMVAGGVHGARILRWRRSIAVRYDPTLCSVDDLLGTLDAAVADTSPVTTPIVAGGARRLGYLAAAAATFGLAILGAMLPVLPTVPFLLLTSYFLVRSSPALNARLERSRFFGTMLRDWREHRGMSRATKAWLFGLMIVILLVTVVVTGIPLAGIPLLLLAATPGIWFMLRIPPVPREREAPLPAGA